MGIVQFAGLLGHATIPHIALAAGASHKLGQPLVHCVDNGLFFVHSVQLGQGAEEMQNEDRTTFDAILSC